MGLDCTAYEKIELVEKVSLKKMQELGWEHPKYDTDEGKTVFLWNMDDFIDRSDGLAEGIYAWSGKTLGFRAGSYSGYNSYRRLLAEIAGVTPDEVWKDPDKYKGVPFFEQINFADNEGFLGPKTCAKLLGDYKEHRAKAEKVMNATEYHGWFESYEEWIEALTIAADHGAITFH